MDECHESGQELNLPARLPTSLDFRFNGLAPNVLLVIKVQQLPLYFSFPHFDPAKMTFARSSRCS